MKVTMINDCAFVGETLLKYLPASIEKEHIKRTGGLWSKTFGIAYKVFRAEADVYHGHYLLQDTYIANRLMKKPLVGHAHGSDLRTTLKHRIWGRIVRYNLKKCDKVLVSTPDVLGQAKVFREDAEYLPNPVDKEFFHSKPANLHDGRKRVLIASDSNWMVKGTDISIRALARVKDIVDVSIIAIGVDFAKTVELANSLGLRLNILPRARHDRLNRYYWDADIVIDRFTLGSLGMVSLEAIACGRPTLCYVSSDYPENKDFPLKDLRVEEEIAELIANLPSDLWEREHEYLERHHNVDAVVSRLESIYQSLL
jgi:glycosyltransferase involved in cell wall biosynthesis